MIVKLRYYRKLCLGYLLLKIKSNRCQFAFQILEISQMWLTCRLPEYCRTLLKTWAATWQNQQNDYAPSEDSDQPGHLPSLIRVFAVRMKKAWVLSYPLSVQRWLWSDWADAQADLSLRWAHSHFVGFIMSLLTSFWHSNCNGKSHLHKSYKHWYKGNCLRFWFEILKIDNGNIRVSEYVKIRQCHTATFWPNFLSHGYT